MKKQIKTYGYFQNLDNTELTVIVQYKNHYKKVGTIPITNSVPIDKFDECYEPKVLEIIKKKGYEIIS